MNNFKGKTGAGHVESNTTNLKNKAVEEKKNVSKNCTIDAHNNNRLYVHEVTLEEKLLNDASKHAHQDTNQVYQFSCIYWKLVRQQNLPVTIKYPEMVAPIASIINK
ncbi:MAG: hypothetical protein LBS55_02620 [Prevotellaceae bacterium]|nr:hypothetical protein [Prevotellaceae bacterium]